MDGVIQAMAQEGASVDAVIRSGETLVWMCLRARKYCERLCGDLLAVH
jgi:hypothetical protein